MTLRCKAGDLAVVLYDTLECAPNIGRFVRVRGPVEFNHHYGEWCWLIEPVSPALWLVDRGGLITAERVTNESTIEHPDRWLKPIRPDELDADAELARCRLDEWRARRGSQLQTVES